MAGSRKRWANAGGYIFARLRRFMRFTPAGDSARARFACSSPSLLPARERIRVLLEFLGRSLEMEVPAEKVLPA